MVSLPDPHVRHTQHLRRIYRLPHFVPYAQTKRLERHVLWDMHKHTVWQAHGVEICTNLKSGGSTHRRMHLDPSQARVHQTLRECTFHSQLVSKRYTCAYGTRNTGTCTNDRPGDVVTLWYAETSWLVTRNVMNAFAAAAACQTLSMQSTSPQICNLCTANMEMYNHLSRAGGMRVAFK